MAEIQMQDYEEIRRENDDHKYDDLKVDEKTVNIDNVLVPSWKKWIKTNCLALTIYMVSTGFVLTVIYFTVIAQLRQKLLDIDMRLTAIENKNGTKLRESENRESTDLDTHTTCYNGGISKQNNNEYICVCTKGFLGKQCGYSGGKDTSFMVIFQEGISYYPTTPKILVASENTTRLSIRYFHENKIHTITMDKSNTEYNLSKSVLPSDGIHMAGVELHSDKGINVYGFFFGTGVSGGYSATPTRFASTKYIISSLPSFLNKYSYKNVIALTPGYQNTVVSINLKLKSGSVTYDNKQYSNNDTIRIMINKYDTFQLSATSDLSGTMVTSSKPVIVVSGNQCNSAVPDNIRAGSCNPFIESVLPTDQLDDMFITPYISTRLNNTVRIQAVNSTNLTIKTGNKTISKTLNARDFFYFYYNTISFISSSEDILVTSYPHGLSEGKGDPFMITIPGVNQYLYKYDFVVPTGFDSYISITVQSDATGGLFLDGNSSKSQSSVFSISEGMNNFSTFSLPISAGLHRIEHKKKVRFGLWIYGNGDPLDGYGYPAGMAYKAHN
ncbi:IgGFc-binding protein-like [Mytilus edulis]|uniref:IgGFc-binding protein-like n=1 Tax=Mytilus edulis TaxID=6550 RepID=UPI0039EFF539